MNKIVKSSVIFWQCFVIIGGIMLHPAFGQGAQQKQPNIIFLLTDDQTIYSLGCYGNKDVITPNIDKLASDGLVFDKYYATSPICMASRSTIMTGKYEYKTGVNFNQGNMKVEDWSLSYPVLLRNSGYYTGFAGKFGFYIDGKGWGQKEFDVYGGGPDQTKYATDKNPTMVAYADKYPHSTRAYGAFGQDVIKQAVQLGKPFCLSISFKAAHKPDTPDRLDDKVYAGKKFTKPVNFGRKYSTYMPEQSKHGHMYGLYDSWGYEKNYDKVMATYHQLIYGVDVAVGMIRAELEQQGVADNTIIFYTADNGYLCGAHGYAAKILPFEESARVPMIIYDPRSKSAHQGLRTAALSGNIDVMPTILDLVGLPIPSDVDGKSLVPLLADPSKELHDVLYLMNTWGETPSTYLAVVTKNLKYTYWWYSDASMKPAENLFDVGKDPAELSDLVNDPEYSAALEQMRNLYDAKVETWKKDAVTTYKPYGFMYDRNIPAESKPEPVKQAKRSDMRDASDVEQ